jgi:uncharacterized membrane protein
VFARLSSYDQIVTNVVKTVEVVGAAIMVCGGLASFVVFGLAAWNPGTRSGSYEALRRNLGRSILLGLEVLILADIVRTIIVAPTLESVAVLGAIVIVRVILSLSLEVEVDGVWPWARWRRNRAASSAPTE